MDTSLIWHSTMSPKVTISQKNKPPCYSASSLSLNKQKKTESVIEINSDDSLTSNSSNSSVIAETPPQVEVNERKKHNDSIDDHLTGNKENKAMDGNSVIVISSSPEEDSKGSVGNDVDVCEENILDQLYGTSWRAKKDEVLSKTVPRSKVHSTHKVIPKNSKGSERIPKKFSLVHKNPYLDSEITKSQTLLRTLHSARIRAALESPIVNKWKDLCDSPSDSSLDCVKKKLEFDDSEEEEDVSKSNQELQKHDCKSSANEEDVVEDSDSGKETLLEKRHVKESVKSNFSIKSERRKENTSKADGKEHKVLRRNKKKKNQLPFTDSSSDSDGNCNISYFYSDSDDNEIINPDKCLTGNMKSDETDSAAEQEKNDMDVEKKKKGKKELDSDLKSKTKTKKNIKLIKTELNKPISEKCYGFLTSLSKSIPIEKSDPAAVIFRNNFKTYRTELTAVLFKLYNETVFENRIPPDTPIEWSTKMRKTAGFCKCRRFMKGGVVTGLSIRIELSTKVVDRADRLRDTLLHEMCHAATWVVDRVANGHGEKWKAWASKAMAAFPELPPVKTCHDYNIQTKYTYKCTQCGYSFGRHSKSLDLERKRCGYCSGAFELLINKTNKSGKIETVTSTPKKAATGFALFVKENYGLTKTPQLKHGEVMKILGQKFSEMKVQKEITC